MKFGRIAALAIPRNVGHQQSPPLQVSPSEYRELDDSYPDDRCVDLTVRNQAVFVKSAP